MAQAKLRSPLLGCANSFRSYSATGQQYQSSFNVNQLDHLRMDNLAPRQLPMLAHAYPGPTKSSAHLPPFAPSFTVLRKNPQDQVGTCNSHPHLPIARSYVVRGTTCMQHTKHLACACLNTRYYVIALDGIVGVL